MTAPRFELSGVMTPSGPPGPGNPSNPPQLLLTYNANDTLNVEPYLDQGYTRADVICIGGGGGGGGFVDSTLSLGSTGALEASAQKIPGGAGGGGGVQYAKRVVLAQLPASVPIVVGAGGAAGLNKTVANVATTTDGGDGGASTFNGTTCRASGGKGGKRAAAVGSGVNIASNGGDGGIGGSTVAGGGGAGGVAGIHSPSDVSAVAAVPGSWNPATGIGSGGGGGAGGHAAMGAQTITTLYGNVVDQASNGAGGAYNASDLSMYSPGSTAGLDLKNGAVNDIIIPGYGGGAKASILTGLSTTYGDSQVSPNPTSPGALSPPGAYGYDPAHPGGAQPGKAGVVIVRLTAS